MALPEPKQVDLAVEATPCAVEPPVHHLLAARAVFHQALLHKVQDLVDAMCWGTMHRWKK